MKKTKFIKKDKISQLPKTPGVYFFKKGRRFLYIGKAANVRERVKNHFPSRSEGERRTNVLRTQQPGFRENIFLDKVKKIGYLKTNSEIEALILEANLIKKYQPKYNIVWRDDKNYFYVEVTKENFPRVSITHQPSATTKIKSQKSKIKNIFIGPFVDGKSLKTTLKILRKVFPYRTCRTLPKRPCLWYQLQRCPAPCLFKTKLGKQLLKVGQKMKRECQKNTKNLIKILGGKKKIALSSLKKEMKVLAKKEDFEMAAKIKNQITALEKVLSNAKIFDWAEPKILVGLESPRKTWGGIEKELKKILKTRKQISRIEAYDVSNIQGQKATGSMVTFIKGKPNKNFYRKFKIKISGKPNDIAMLKECLTRRFKHPEWGLPDLILIDGGIAQLNAAIKTKNKEQRTKNILVIAIAKRVNKLYIENKKQPVLLKTLPREIFNLILQLRDEAHRFAITYHRKLRKIDLFLKS